MFDVIPWLDEVHIVEMGRMFLCGGDADSVLIGENGFVMMPAYYVAPLIQECAFRLFGQLGVRLSPLVGLIAMWLFFRKWLGSAYSWNRLTRELAGLSLLTCPLLFQCIVLARPDTWPLAFTFAALAVLGKPCAPRSVWRIFAGAFLAVLSVFSWPSSIMTAMMYPVFCFSTERKREFVWFCFAASVSAVVIALPLLPRLDLYVSAFFRHSSETAPVGISAMDVCLMLSREFARSPFLALIGCVGFFAWLRNRRCLAILSLCVGLAIGIVTRLYLFRIVYLTPLLAILCADAVDFLRARRPRTTAWLLVLAVAYGIVSGPVGNLFLDYPRLPQHLKEELSRTVGVGPKVVYAPDFSVYYIGRELGWHQLAFGVPSNALNERLVREVCERADAAVFREGDPYETIQQSLTPYGLFCKYVLHRAKQEAHLPDAQKSWFARFGAQAATSWCRHVVPEGFREVDRFGEIRVFVRETQDVKEGMGHE